MGNSSDIIHFKLEPDPEPKKVSEHGPSIIVFGLNDCKFNSMQKNVHKP